MSLTCPGCGAPVRWRGKHPVVECRYCGTHVATGSGQKTDAPAQVVSRMRPRTLLLAYGSAGLFTVLMVGVSLVGALLGRPGGITGTSVAEVATLSMASTIEQVCEATGADAYSETSVCIYYSGGVWDYVCLTWDEDLPEHVQSFSFHSSHEDDAGTAGVADLLGSNLGRRFYVDGDGALSWGWAGAWLHGDHERTFLSVSSDPESDDGWRVRMALLWAAVVGANLGNQTDVDEVTARQWLGQGYRPLALATLDITIDVDQASSQVTATVPGAVESRWSGLTFEVPIDHPQLGGLDLGWANAAGGKVDSISFDPPPGRDAFPDQAALQACITAIFGPPEDLELDHLAGTRYQMWEPEGLASVHLYPTYLSVSAWSWHGDPPSNATWTKLLRALDSCP
jgi:hypothetical protein